MTDQAIQLFLAARGKVGQSLEDYNVGSNGSASPASFSSWDVQKLGPAPTALEITAIERQSAQIVITNWPIETRAMLLTLLDQLNVIRQALPAPLPVITPATALAAVATKAGQIS